MSVIFTISARAVRSLLAPGIPSLFLLCAAMSALSLMLIGSGATYMVHTTFFSHLTQEWQIAAGIVESVIAFVAACFFFPLLLPIIVSFFDDRIASLIEAHEYPDCVLAHPPSFARELWHDIRFSIRVVVLNIILLPLYLVPGLNLVLFYALNGYLLGKQFFTTIATRYVPRDQAAILAQPHRLTIGAAGFLVVFSATIPFANLIAPIWAVALMVHLFHSLYPKRPYAISAPVIDQKSR